MLCSKITSYRQLRVLWDGGTPQTLKWEEVWVILFTPSSPRSTLLLHNNTPRIFLHPSLPPLISLVALLQIFPLEVNHRDQEKLNTTNKETESQNPCQSAGIHQEDDWVIHKRDMRIGEVSLLWLYTFIHHFTIQERGEMSHLTNQREKKKVRKLNTWGWGYTDFIWQPV